MKILAVLIYVFLVLFSSMNNKMRYCELRVDLHQGRKSQKTRLPSFTQILVVFQKTGKNYQLFGLKSGQKPIKGQG